MAKTTKGTARNQRAKKSGEAFNANHNFFDRTRNAEPHINHDMTKENIYYKIDSNGNWERVGSFNANKYELARFNDVFGDGINARNERYIKQGHIENTKTVQEVYKNKKTAPMETILQISNTKDLKAQKFTKEELAQKLDEAAQKTIKGLQKKYGKNIEFYDYALHMDEGVPHCHIRYSFKVQEKGYTILNQSKALKEMGFDVPDPTQKRSRYNNPLISFSDHFREQFYKNCEEHNIIIDREVVSQSRRQDELAQFKYQQLQQDIQELEAQKSQLIKDVEVSKELNGTERPEIVLEQFKKSLGGNGRIVPENVLKGVLAVYNAYTQIQEQIDKLLKLKLSADTNKRVQELEQRLNNGLRKARQWEQDFKEKDLIISQQNNEIEQLKNRSAVEKDFYNFASVIYPDPSCTNITLKDVVHQVMKYYDNDLQFGLQNNHQDPQHWFNLIMQNLEKGNRTKINGVKPYFENQEHTQEQTHYFKR